MPDVTTRGNTSSEEEPLNDNYVTGADASHFASGVINSQDWKAMLANGVQLPSPGAPVPVMYSGGSLSDPRPAPQPEAYGSGPVPNQPAVTGMHQDPQGNNTGAPLTMSGGSIRKQGAGSPSRLVNFGIGG